MHPAALKNTVEASLAGQSYVTKASIAVLILFWLVSKWSTWAYKMLAASPGMIGPPQMHIWTILTGGLVENNVIFLVVDVVALAGAGGVFEPLWGTIEYGKFLVVVTAGTTLGSGMWYILIYAMTADPLYLFMDFGGFWGVLGGYLVAFKQAFPQRRLPFFGLAIVESRHGPLLYVAGLYGLYMAGVFPSFRPVMAAFGVLAAWIYLRFYQEKEGGKGDASETFCFADFFPMALQPAVQVLANRLFKFAVAIKLCQKKPTQYDMSAPSSIKIALPGVTSSDADRRRQIALRDLNARTTRPSSAAGGRGDETQAPTAPTPDKKGSNVVAEVQEGDMQALAAAEAELASNN